MDSLLEPGKYVVAVSGGVDSVVLLDLLVKQQVSVVSSQESGISTENRSQKTDSPSLQLVVAHFDHGIRHDSAKDVEFVRSLAQKYVLEFETAQGHLGAHASEALAREKRYEFLENVKKKHNARSILTAHHYDDMLETAIINLVRGTKRKGLSSLVSNDQIVRPLLKYTKQDLLEYAKSQGLHWREDPTNVDEKYLRNRIRSRLKNASETDKKSLHALIGNTKQTNTQIDELLDVLFQESYQAQSLDKKLFASLAHDMSCEVLVGWLRYNKSEVSSTGVERLVQKIKTASIGSLFDVDKHWVLVIEKDQIRMQPRESV